MIEKMEGKIWKSEVERWSTKNKFSEEDRFIGLNQRLKKNVSICEQDSY